MRSNNETKHPRSGRIDEGAENEGYQPKDNKKLSARQRKVYELLRTGRYSTTDITITLGYGDPRSYIRDLRAKGYPIDDEWVEAGDVRFKRFFVRRDNKVNTADFGRYNKSGEVFITPI